MDFLNLTRSTLTILIFTITRIQTAFSEKYVYKSYQNSAECSASIPIQYPNNAEELQKIILSAIESGTTVKVFGSRHSFTDIICTSGIPISAKNIIYMHFETEKPETVTVGAGAELKDLLDFLHLFGRTLIRVPSFSGITVGGAIGTGAHATTLNGPVSVSDQVVAMTVIDGLGNIQKIEDVKELQGFRVHLGLLGAIVDVTLKTVPSYKMEMHNYPAKETVLLDGTALKMAQTLDWFQLWWFPFSEDVVISEGKRVSSETNGNAKTNYIPDSSPLELLTVRLAFEAMQATKNLVAQYAVEEFFKFSLYKEVIGKPPIFETENKNFANPAIGWAYQLQSNRCSNKCAWQNGEKGYIFPIESAFAVEVSQFPNVIRKIKEILSEIPASFPLVGIQIRFCKKSDALMSMYGEWDSVVLELPAPKRTDPYETARSGLGAYQAIMEAMNSEFKATFHWGKNGQEFSTWKYLEKIPADRLQAFQNMMKKYDPNRLFMNNFGTRLFLKQDVLTKPLEVKHCALEEYCICQENRDCADDQFCGEILEKKYKVCKDRPSLISLPPVLCVPGTNYDPFNLTDIVRCYLPKVLEDSGNLIGSLVNGVIRYLNKDIIFDLKLKPGLLFK